ARLLKYDKEDVKKSYIKEKGKEESYAEEIRLLYVAMTRAKEQLFLLGGRDAIKEKKNKVDPAAMFDEDGRMKKQSILEKKTYLEWVEAIVSYHKPASISMEVEAAQMPDVPEIEIIPEEKTVGDDAGHEGRITDKMKEKVFWSYPGDWKARIPKVISVSAVKHGRMEQAAEELAEEEGGGLAVSFDPVFRSDKERGASEGALRGTAYHEIMARCDMKDMSTPEGRERQLENILKNGYLTEKELKLVPGEWITLFGESKLCQRICRSPLVVREKDFVVSMTLEELDRLKAGMNYGSDSGESVILQGIIDIFFYEGEDIVLVDYKTDYDLDEKTVEGYKVQLEIYSKALEAATGRKVKEKLLYAVRTGKEIPC
ncbi:MAG: PD-(D/E)XK nuclease family protein, partial [Lachnospiraceae bacterium]|nr:PD-(D/E)XK nuclease family protein [Lachnospiraceae bacterium]